ncbi:hypothetical protein ACO0LL_29010 [Undibacterium sp. TC4M20W]|uniref:hypothetical protein n=1 Tax=Undibacterium sp. TC4M20W TaxID=3413052 RepID=UPI003BF0A3B0
MNKIDPPTDIVRLSKKRQRNVQEQNRLSEYGLRTTATYWRAHALPKALHDAGLAHGIDWGNSIIIDLVADLPWMRDTVMGTILSQQEKFIEFEIETSQQHQLIKSIEVWLDVTAQANVHKHNRGTGRGAGAMALEIRRELCTPAGSPSADSSTTECAISAF